MDKQDDIKINLHQKLLVLNYLNENVKTDVISLILLNKAYK